MKKAVFILLSFFTIFSVKAIDFDLNSKYAYVYNLTDDKVMYEKNKDEQAKIASMTKIMTAIIVIENNKDLDKTITIKEEDLRDIFEYTTTGFQNGHKVTIKELLYGILLKSGSDAVNAAVRITTSSEEDFVDLMNKKVNELGLKNTKFSNPIGKDEGNYSSAYDIAKIMEYCLKNEDFKKIISTDMYYIDSLNLQINGPLYKMDTKYNIDLSMIDGAKSGFTSLAKHSLVSYGENNGVTLITVTNCADSFKDLLIDNSKIYNYYFNNYGYKDYNIKFNIDISNAKLDKYEIDLNTKLYLPNDYDESLINYKYIGTNLITPLNIKGSTLGTLSIYYDKDLIKTVKLKLDKDIKFKTKAYMPIFILVVIFIILVLFIIIKKRIKKIKKKLKKFLNNKNKSKINKEKQKIKTFIKEENSIEKKLRILKNTTNVELFFDTLKTVNYTYSDKLNFEHDFIDRCFESINFKSLDELQELYTKLNLYKSEMESKTIKYYNKLFKYCINEYIK